MPRLWQQHVWVEAHTLQTQKCASEVALGHLSAAALTHIKNGATHMLA